MTCRGLTRPDSKSTVSEPGLPISINDVVFIDADRSAGLVTEGAGGAEAPAGRIAGPCGEGMTLVVIRDKARSVLDDRHLVFEEQPARDRTELHDSRVRVAHRSGPAVPRRDGHRDVEPVRVLARDAVGDGDGGAEEDVRVVHVVPRAGAHAEASSVTPRDDVLLERDVERRLALRRHVRCRRRSSRRRRTATARALLATTRAESTPPAAAGRAACNDARIVVPSRTRHAAPTRGLHGPWPEQLRLRSKRTPKLSVTRCWRPGTRPARRADDRDG